MKTKGKREIEVIMLRLQSGLHLDLFVRWRKIIGNKNFKVTGKMGGCPRYKIRSGNRKKRGKWGKGEAEKTQSN